MDWTEKQRCVLCNRGGKLLVCNDDGCPISVHKNCMGCEARFDALGNFYCPYCLYRQLAAEKCQLRDKAILAKKALSTFLDKEMRDRNYQEPNTCRIMVVYEATSKPVVAGVDQVLCKEKRLKAVQLEADVSRRVSVKDLTKSSECKDDRVVDDASIETAALLNNKDMSASIGKQKHMEVKKENYNRKKQHRLESGTTVFQSHQKRSHSEAYDENENRRKKHKTVEQPAETTVSLQPAGQLQSKSGINDNNLDNLTFSKQQRYLRDRPTCVFDQRNGVTSGPLEAVTGTVSRPQIINTSNPGELKDKQQPVTEMITQLPTLNGRRRVRWSSEEEDMLKEGVHKFSTTMQKKLPWKKVLEFGRHVFDASRTPSDLKDKWRNMAKQAP